MKCPKCGINYDDSDRECPMCGAPKPLFAKDKSQLAKTTARPAKSDEKRDNMGSILDLGSNNNKNSWSKPKKSGKNKIGIIVIIAVVIINFIPTLIGLLSNLVSDIPQQIKNVTVHVEPEPVPDDEISIDLTNSYMLDNDEIQFSIFNDGTYCVTGAEFNEWGDIITYEYDLGKVPEFETFLLDNGIIIDDFNIIIAILTAVDSTQDRYLIIAESYNDEQTFFYDLNSDINWLDDGVLLEGYRFV
ncbi:MAG TPA: zinc ribbon domain-containing protein [Candidatus Butyricicoccus avistercoris]|uniref:Zinc ribbon domain-containing protein n=1 Tax=Candidatus Butyricicoccus avistercoris TaxID=2838518 RepID=A0A9D1PHX7_9FIRM|nr:zinc ribbon domain-containing protein [Candidatus Butyricicoccus avistercoris]